jgi:hypothetical protein
VQQLFVELCGICIKVVQCFSRIIAAGDIFNLAMSSTNKPVGYASKYVCDGDIESLRDYEHTEPIFLVQKPSIGFYQRIISYKLLSSAL